MNFLRRWQSLIISCLISVAFASAGALFTNLDDWYFNLKQPSWKPPDEAFGLIWSIIFACGAAAAWLSWNSARNHRQKILFLILFLFNGFLNMFWSVLYFQLHRPDLSFLECFALLLSVLSLIVVPWKTTKLASILVIPYFIWVSIATVLNWQTVVLNGF